MNYIGMYTRSKKGIKTRTETTRGLHGKGNEIISRCSFSIKSCLVLNDNVVTCANVIKACYTISIQVKSTMTTFAKVQKLFKGDDNIHLSSFMAREKMRNLSLYVSSTFQCCNYNNISKSIMGYSAFTPA